MTVGELSSILHRSNVDTIKSLMRTGVMATVNEVVDFETAARVAASFKVPVLKPKDREESTAGIQVGVDEELTAENAQTRPPIITVLGHVDHGKTTLLDAIRGTTVVDSEAGGITQSVGAYQVRKEDNLLTFIDTPGHEAFTSMRASGAQVTDIAVLVVAADDGVMPQTREAIDHARAADVPIVVAINKIDLDAADLDRTRAALADNNIIVEEYGGDIVSVQVSALKGDGVDDLLDALVLVAEISELQANPERAGLGVVIESHMDRSRGPMSTIVVRSGTVRKGDNVVAGVQRGRVRDMVDGFGETIDEAGPSTPIEVLGLDGLPAIGDQFEVVPDEKTARQLVETRRRIAARRGEVRQSTTLAEVMRSVHRGEFKKLGVVIKASTQGSVDAVRRAVEQLSTPEVQVNVVLAAAGAITESDVMLAAASDAIVVGFESELDTGAAQLAAARGVSIRSYRIIYDLIDDVQAAVSGLVEPEEREVVTGHALIQEVFPLGRRNNIAGVRIIDGTVRRNSRIRVKRSGNELFSGRVASMRHLRDNVRELGTNFEGGIVLDGFDDFEVQDILEAYEIQVLRR
jgi:translation initiation factor IF-2